ncbi:MAG: PorP/SprF family type IX secretion system membrane protein [Bacteroidota bacterium]
MKYLYCTSLLIALSYTLSAQQPAQYSTYMLDPMRYNPAYAGLDYGLSVTGTYRQQWVGLEGAPVGQRVSVHLPLYFLRGGLGFQFENDEIGAHQLTSVQGAYNYQMEMGTGVLSLGVGLSWQQWTLRGGELITPDGVYLPGVETHNDNLLSLASESGAGIQAAAGVYYQSERFEAGLSIENANAGNIQLTQLTYNLASVYHAYVTSNFEVGNSFVVRPSLWFRSDAIENQLDISVLGAYNDNIFAGASFRGYNSASQDAVILMAGFRLSPSLQLMYAYDVGLSPLQSVHNGSHEIVVKYRLDKTIGAGKLPPIIYHPRSRR